MRGKFADAIQLPVVDSEVRGLFKLANEKSKKSRKSLYIAIHCCPVN